MTKLSSIATDPKKERDGIWNHFFGTIHVRIARMGNPNYNRFLGQLRRPHLNKIRLGGDAAVKTLEPLQRKAVANTVCLGWWGMDADVDPVKVEESKARKVEVLHLADGIVATVWEMGGKLYRDVDERIDPTEPVQDLALEQGVLHLQEQVAYSHEVAESIFGDPSNSAFFGYVCEIASDLSGFFAKDQEDARGN